MATAKKTAKKAAPAAVERKATLTPISEITLGTKKRDKSGPKQKLYNLVPKKGHITYRALLAKADEEGLPAAKVKKWIAGWIGKYLAVD